MARELETNRHNLATEGQNQVELGIKQQDANTRTAQLSINASTLAEQSRANRANEAIALANLGETYRSNTAKETNNAFLAYQTARQAGVAERNAATQEYKAETDRMAVSETNRANLAREGETYRHDLAVENETYRNNLMNNSLNLADVQNRQTQTQISLYDSLLKNTASMYGSTMRSHRTNLSGLGYLNNYYQ